MLYLDSDIVVNGSIEDLYNTDVSDNLTLPRLSDPVPNRTKDLEMSEDSKYFNADVMLINLRKWRQKS